MGVVYRKSSHKITFPLYDGFLNCCVFLWNLLHIFKGNKRIPPTNIPSRLTFWSRTGEGKKPQPDNHAGVQAGKLKDVKDTSGLTVEGYQEFYDEACLAVLNNKYNDGIQWHDVPCYFRYIKHNHRKYYQRSSEWRCKVFLNTLS